MILILATTACGEVSNQTAEMAPSLEEPSAIGKTSAINEPSAANSPSTKKPNILLIVADDLGMQDIGAFGSEIRTPNIDQLANQGLQLTNFYTSATCSPTRSMLLSGTDSHAAGMGNMIEHVSPNQRDQDGYEGHLSKDVVSVATLLQDAGYQTYMAGKWHLGKTDDLLPYRRGFDQSFVLLEGGASYFNDMMGLNALVKEAGYRHNEKTITELPDDFYASEYYADFIIDQIQSGAESDKPFFAYLAFTAPHWPLQVRDEHVDLYKGRYDQGYEALHAERLQGMKDSGFVASDVPPAPKPAHVEDWAALDAQQQKVESRTMEIYSATVERMDYHLGRVLASLRESGELDNTLIVFMSDNGADGSDRSKLPGNDKWLPEAWDLSYENMGKKGSYVYPGPAWAWTSAGNHRMYKEFLSEGGIHTPAIISYPGIKNSGARVDDFISVKDIAPTMLEIAGVKHPGTSYAGRTVEPMTGLSLMPIINGDKFNDGAERVLGWELFGQKVIRKGDWKLLWLSSKPRWLVQPTGADQWGLYNLASDPAETNNLVQQQPEKFAEMVGLWEEYSEQQGVILPVWE